jgi:hypothetical protein
MAKKKTKQSIFSYSCVMNHNARKTGPNYLLFWFIQKKRPTKSVMLPGQELKEKMQRQ